METKNTKKPYLKYYWWPERNRLVCLGEQATPDYWNTEWECDDWAKRLSISRNSWYWRYMLNKYLPNKKSKILEAGCDSGHIVEAMSYWGYQATGVDFAAKTIDKIKEVMPNLDVRYGDVHSLEFEDNYFDGYLSLGVIEHFWNGYDDILKEMKRVLKVGGYAFVSVPCISRLEQIIRFSMYKKFEGTEMPDTFFQFVLDINALKEDIERIGFECVYASRKGDWGSVTRFLPRLLSSKLAYARLSQKSWIMRRFRFALTFLMSPLCGNSTRLVLRKK